MIPVTCDECGTIFSSNFCPDCGRKKEDIKITKPVEITTYVHGDKESNQCYFAELGLDIDDRNNQDSLASQLHSLNYEIKIIYKIESGKFIATHVNCGDGQGLCNIVPIAQD